MLFALVHVHKSPMRFSPAVSVFLAWGGFFKSTSWLPGLLVLVATVFLVLAAKIEEAENIRFFGSEYREYMRQTKMFVPFVL